MRGLVLLRRISVLPPTTPGQGPAAEQTRALEKWTRAFVRKFESWMTTYEEFIGIKQVKEAHARVLQVRLEIYISLSINVKFLIISRRRMNLSNHRKNVDKVRSVHVFYSWIS